MDVQIQNLFPTPVAKYKFARQFTAKELDFIEAAPRNYRYGDNAQILNLSGSDSYVLEHPALKEIKTFILESINDYYNEIFRPDNKSQLKITQSWLNFSRYNHSHPSHFHTNSFLSGVFYIFADESFDVIGFSRMFPTFLNNIAVNSKEGTIYTTHNVTLPVHSGDLLIFPSALPHYVPASVNDVVTRTSLAFNTFISGEIGHQDTQNHLSIEIV